MGYSLAAVGSYVADYAGTISAVSAAAAAGTGIYAATRGQPKPALAATPKDPSIDAFRQKNAQSTQRGYSSAASALLTGNTAGNFASSPLLGN